MDGVYRGRNILIDCKLLHILAIHQTLSSYLSKHAPMKSNVVIDFSIDSKSQHED
jgi:hypothetical protein